MEEGMRVSLRHGWRDNDKDMSVEDAVYRECVDNEHERAADCVRESTRKTAEFMGKLVTLLNDRGLLSDADVLSLLGGGYELAQSSESKPGMR